MGIEKDVFVIVKEIEGTVYKLEMVSYKNEGVADEVNIYITGNEDVLFDNFTIKQKFDNKADKLRYFSEKIEPLFSFV